jgi:hypothetical protein
MFTHREKTVKNKTVADAIAAAKSVLKERGITKYCINAVSRRDTNEQITVEEMSNLVEKIVDDTHFYNN